MLKTNNIEIGMPINQFAHLTPAEFAEQYPEKANIAFENPLCIYLLNIGEYLSCLIRRSTRYSDLLSQKKAGIPLKEDYIDTNAKSLLRRLC